MPAVLHILDASSDDDVITVDVRHHHEERRPQLALAVGRREPGRDARLTDLLGHRCLGAVPLAGRRPWQLATAAQRVLAEVRELRIRLGGPVVVVGHGAVAGLLARFAAAAGDEVRPVVEDTRPELADRLLPPAGRIVVSSFGDLDRALEAGVPARHLSVVPPGIDGDEQDLAARPFDERLAIVGETGPLVARLREQAPWAPLAAFPATRPVRVVIDSETRLTATLLRLAVAGVPLVGADLPWANEVGTAVVDVASAGGLAAQVKKALGVRARTARPPKKELRRPARDEALEELWDITMGPRPEELSRLRRHLR